VKGRKAGFEAKTAGYAKGWGEHGENVIPDYYLCQVAHYSIIDNAEMWYIGALIGGNDFRHYTYERNHKLEDIIIKKATEFWECVKNETPPTPRTPDEVISLFSSANDDEIIIADDSIENAVDSLRSLKDIIKEHEEQKTKLETMIKIFMQGKDTLKSRSDNRTLATWKNQKGAVRFDAKKFAEENEKLYEQYLKAGAPSRRFCIK
jgi:predicted phage-related endonuclease